jgi:lipopolysaccharide/colanic/teichoic acid biosynthesis glycosyltransferase
VTGVRRACCSVDTQNTPSYKIRKKNVWSLDKNKKRREKTYSTTTTKRVVVVVVIALSGIIFASVVFILVVIVIVEGHGLQLLNIPHDP